MRILHTSDWHLGAMLKKFSRLDEQQQVLNEIYRIAVKQKVDIVLIAGDIYDTYNPPARAEEMFLSLMDRLSKADIRCVAIAGNHDSPDKLCAPGALAGSHGIYLLGTPDVESDQPKAKLLGPDIIETAPNFISVRCASGEVCEIAALPYPSPGRIKSEEGRYSADIGALFNAAASHFKIGNVHIAMTHVFAAGGKADMTERPIEGVGGALCVAPEMLCPQAQYVALGHLHRPQKIQQNRMYYSGSIIKQDFSETNQLKSVLLVDVEPGGEPQVTELPLVSVRNLVHWQVDSYDEALAKLESATDSTAWLELVINIEEAISEHDLRKLREKCDRLVNIRTLGRGQVIDARPLDWNKQSPEKLFREFYKHTKGYEPGREIMSLFMEMLNDSEGE